MTKPSTIPHHQLSITCGVCKHHSMLEGANLIFVVSEDATTPIKSYERDEAT